MSLPELRELADRIGVGHARCSEDELRQRILMTAHG